MLRDDRGEQQRVNGFKVAAAANTRDSSGIWIYRDKVYRINSGEVENGSVD